MIKIEISDEKRKEIEKLHWEWFKQKFYHKHHLYFHKHVITRQLGLNESDLGTIVIGQFNDAKFIEINDKIKFLIEKFKQKKYYADWKKRITNIFNYESFRDDDEQWNSYALFLKLGVNVCTYCNRQYVFTVFEKKDSEGNIVGRITAPELDHFFPQDEYPHLSCSLYNFIPSCHICNHRKSNSVNGILYPYEDDFGKNFPFCVKFSNLAAESKNLMNIENASIFFKALSCNSIPLNLPICKKCQKVDASIKTFHLEEIYNKHKIDLKDLFDRYRNYCKPKIDEITKLVLQAQLGDDCNDKTISTIAKTYSRRMKNMILGIPLGAKDKQYPLRKFKEDIIEQLDETYKKMRK